MVSPAIILERSGVDEFEIDERSREVKVPERHKDRLLDLFGMELLRDKIIGVEAYGWKWFFVEKVWNREKNFDFESDHTHDYDEGGLF